MALTRDRLIELVVEGASAGAGFAAVLWPMVRRHLAKLYKDVATIAAQEKVSLTPSPPLEKTTNPGITLAALLKKGKK